MSVIQYNTPERVADAQELLGTWMKERYTPHPETVSYAIFFTTGNRMNCEKPIHVLINYREDGQLKSETLNLEGKLLDTPRNPSLPRYHEVVFVQQRQDYLRHRN
jgi:hypothetical protein